MEPKIFSLSENAAVAVIAGGDLFIWGENRADVQVSVERDQSMRVQEDNNLLRLVCGGDAMLRVPAGASVRVENVGADLYLTGLTGRVEIQRVGGDLVLEQCDRMDIGLVGGDCMAHAVRGALTIRKVGGDFCAYDLSGPVTLESAGGDALVNAAGVVRLRAGGDLEFISPAPEGEVELRAGGDVKLCVLANADVRLEISSGAHAISLERNGQVDQIESGDYQYKQGQGAQLIRVRAGGDVDVTDQTWKMNSFDGVFRAMQQAGLAFESGTSSSPKGWSAETEERVRQRAEEGARRAEERVREAMERVDRQLKQRSRDLDALSSTQNFPLGGPIPTPAGFVAEVPMEVVPAGVTNEERMLVLKMLQEHKLSVEEAEQLLSTLDGHLD